ncbi:MAG: hypothetical protein MJY55_00630 [Bacteroidales bacterium]|nr:hypothetical protein [Bacteroidales bacterium]
MKTRSAIFSTLCIFAFAAISCTKEGNAPQDAAFEPFRLDAVSEAAKTHLDGLDVIWDNGDALSAFSVNAATHTNNKLECTSYGTRSASFSGQIDDGTTSFYAVYPYGELSYSDGVVSGAVIPATQTATNGSFSNGVSLAVASGTKTPGDPDCGSLGFKNLCAVLSFTLPEDIDFAKQIVISSKSGAGMAGAVSIDCAKQTISGAGASSVTLNGDFVGGGTYYIAVAPGEYANGFRFTITSDKGNSYTRETTKTVSALAGTIYPLGTLSLALAGADFTHSVSITHDYTSQTLTGSTATLNVEVNKSEFAYAVKEIRVENVKLVRNSVTYCTLGSHSAGGSRLETSLTNTSSTPYIPKGDYSYSADVCYTVTSSAGKTTERKVSISGKATSVSPDPAKFTLDANFSGYTSYSCYKGTDGKSANVNDANNCDNATIYGIGASYKSGLRPDVYNQCSSLLSISSTLDGNAAYGNVGGQTWAAHTIGATWSFDGASGTCNSEKTVYITGLPYNANPPKNSGSHPWTLEGGKGKVTFENNRIKFIDGTATSDPKVQSPSFVIPANIPVKISYKASVIAKKVLITYDGELYVKLSGVNFYNKTTSNTSEQITETTTTGTLTVSEPYLQAGNSKRTALGGGGYLYYVKLEYRQ